MGKTISPFVDRVVENPNTYLDQNSVNYTFTRNEGTITEEGTLLNAVSLNPLVDGIRDLSMWQNAVIENDATYVLNIEDWENTENSLLHIYFETAMNENAPVLLNINGLGYNEVISADGEQLIGSQVQGKANILRYNAGKYVKLGSEGSIEESGSNANGSWIKYTDGTMICYNEVEEILDLNVIRGAVFSSGRYSRLTYPQTFYTIPYTSQYLAFGDLAWLGCSNYPPSTEMTQNYVIYSATARTAVQIRYGYIAIGKWK